MELNIIDSSGKQSDTMVVSEVLFGREYNEPLVHQLVVAYHANARSGNRKQKDREEVRHTTAKPFKQKGTGRARAGMSSSPLWRGGGRIFPNSPDENFTQKINRKMHRAGLAVILSQLVRENKIAVVEDFSVEAPKTKLVIGKIDNMGFKSVLVITEKLDENLALGYRNLPNVMILEPHQVDPVSLLHYPKVLMTRAAVAKLEEILV
jgi:large subunit ribosomal protein L4